MNNNKEVICIICPKGCHLQVSPDLNVSGNGCKRGIKYGISEVTEPKRSITSTVVVQNGEITRLPVITSKPIPKGQMFSLMEEINKITVTAPINIHQIIIKNVLDLDVNIIATRSVKEKK